MPSLDCSRSFATGSEEIGARAARSGLRRRARETVSAGRAGDQSL